MMIHLLKLSTEYSYRFIHNGQFSDKTYVQRFYFDRQPKSWREVFSLIETSHLGKETLTKFFHLVKSTQVTIQEIPKNLRAEFRGAYFLTDGQHGIVHIDPSAQLGILAPYLVHEMTHALDETIWRAARYGIKTREKPDLIFQSECRAFHSQHRFQEELKARFPELRKFHETHYAHIPFLNRALEPCEIFEMYRNAIID